MIICQLDTSDLDLQQFSDCNYSPRAWDVLIDKSAATNNPRFMWSFFEN